MPAFFPKHTIELHLEEPRAFRRMSFSLVEMALVTGVVIRVYRSFVLTHGPTSWLYFGGTLILGILIFLAMATAHLANYPIHRWVWRAPLFALVEAVGEMAASVFLVLLRREPYGTVRAEWHDWPSMAINTLLTRGLTVVSWALLLAGIIILVRHTIVHEEEDKPEEAPLI